MYKNKPWSLTAGIVKSNFKVTVKISDARDEAFWFMIPVNGTQVYWKQFLYDLLALVKQLGIPVYFLTLSCADQRSEELPYIIKKLNNLKRSDKELKKIKLSGTVQSVK